MTILPFVLATFLGMQLCFAQRESNDEFTKFAKLESRTGGRIGVEALDVARNRRIEYHAQEPFLMCSTFKVLAVAAVLKRIDEDKEKLDRFVKYGEADLLTYAPVTRAHVKEGGMTLEALCAAAIQQSDNTAANLLLESIGGPKGVTDFARALGDNFTRLDRKEPELNTSTVDEESDTTRPIAMGNDLQRLFMTDVLSPASRTRFENWLLGSETGLQLIRASVPAGWEVGDKTGRSGDGATNDVAILRPPSGGPIFIAVYTVYPGGTAEECSKLVADAARIAIDALKK